VNDGVRENQIGFSTKFVRIADIFNAICEFQKVSGNRKNYGDIWQKLAFVLVV